MNSQESFLNIKDSIVFPYTDEEKQRELTGPLIDKIIDIVSVSSGVNKTIILENIINNESSLNKISEFCMASSQILKPHTSSSRISNIDSEIVNEELKPMNIKPLIITVGMWKVSNDGYILGTDITILVNESISQLQPGKICIMTVFLPRVLSTKIETIDRQEVNKLGGTFTLRCAVPLLGGGTNRFDSIGSISSNGCNLLHTVYTPVLPKVHSLSYDRLNQSMILSNQIINSIEQSIQRVQPAVITVTNTIQDKNNEIMKENTLERAESFLAVGKDISALLIELAVLPSVVHQSEMYLTNTITTIKNLLSRLSEVRWRTIKCPINPVNRLSGLDAELEYWRSATIQLATLLQYVSEPRHKINVYIVRAAVASNKLLEWLNIEKSLVRYTCEAHENFKYIFSLSRSCAPLYRRDLQTVKIFLPSLMYSVKLLCKLSRFYSHPQAMSDLILCLCSQLVQCCKKCLLEIANSKVSHLENLHFQQVVDLCRMYLDLTNELLDTTVSGTREKAASAMPMLGQVYQATEALDNISRDYTFSPVNMFLQRIVKILHVRRITESYGSQLDTISLRAFTIQADNLENLVERLSKGLDNFSTDYSLLLEEDDAEFDFWYENSFLKDLDELNSTLISSLKFKVRAIFKSKCRSVNEALSSVKRIESMKIDALNDCVNELYSEIVEYMRSIEFTKVLRIYENEKHCSNRFHNIPEPAAQIRWARSLYNRIKEPVSELIRIPSISKAEIDSLKRGFDKTVKVFVMYELVVHRHWLQSLGNLINLLKCPLLVEEVINDSKAQGDEGSRLVNRIICFHLNYDPFLECVAQSTIELTSMGITVPPICKMLVDDWGRIQTFVDRFTVMLDKYENIQRRSRERIYCQAVDLLSSELRQLLTAGTIMYNWLSPDIDDYIQKCEIAVLKVDQFLDRVEHLVSNRIHRQLDFIFCSKLINIPKPSMSTEVGKECLTLADFSENVKKETTLSADRICSINSKIENAVKDLIYMFIDMYNNVDVSFEPGQGSILKLGRLGKLQRSIVQTFAITDKGLQRIHNKRSSTSTNLQLDYTDKQKSRQIASECSHIWTYYESRLIDGLIYAVTTDLENLRERLMKKTTTDEDVFSNIPTFCVNVVLDNSTVKLNPDIGKLQKTLNKCVQYILNVTKGVKRWAQAKEIHPNMIHADNHISRLDCTRGDMDSFQNVIKRLTHSNSKWIDDSEVPSGSNRYNLFELPVTTYYHDVRNDIEVNRICKDLNNCMMAQEESLKTSLEALYKYNFIWAPDDPVSDQILSMTRETICIMPMLSAMDKLNSVAKSVEKIDHYKDSFPLRLLYHSFKTEIHRLAERRKINACEHVQKLLIENANTIHAFIQRINRKLDKEFDSFENLKTILSGIIMVRKSSPSIERSCIKLKKAFNAISLYLTHETSVDNSDKFEGLWRVYEKLNSKSEIAHKQLLKVRETFVSELEANINEFGRELEEFDSQYQEKGPMVVGVAAHEASDRMRLFSSRFELIWHQYRTLYEGEQLFNLPHGKFSKLYILRKELTSLSRLYALFDQANQVIDSFKDTVWSKIDISRMMEELSDLMSRCKRMPVSLKKWPAYLELSELITGFLDRIPLLEMLSSDAMQIRHWKSMETIFNQTFNVNDDSFHLGQVMNIPMLEKKEHIEDICIRAMKEKEIEAKLKMLDQEWRSREFKLAPFKMRGEILLKGQDTSEAISTIEDSNLILAGLASNRYNDHFKADIQKFIDDLAVTYEVTTKWIQVQNLWVYLEAVFIGGDISRQLPLEARRFASVDKMWLKMIAKARETPNILSCCISYDNNLEMLNFMFAQLEMCQTSLAGYLESKRVIFPRFYFLSDPVLLEILGQASEPVKLQPYFSSFTESVSHVEFNYSKETIAEDSKSDKHSSIIAIQSGDNETLNLVRPVYTKKTVVEEWLGEFLLSCQDTVKGRIQKCVTTMGNTDFDMAKFFLDEYQQFGLIILQLIWTATAENAIKHQAKTGNSVQKANKYFQNLLNDLIDKTLQDLSPIDRLKYDTYITIHIHQRDVFNDLAHTGIKDLNDFEWTKQSRFYYDDASNAMIVSITDIDFIYGNEFLGCSERLVITPLTDRCYISLAQALGMCYGGSPAGPAGTGKTETTKDMARAIGKYCIVLNCSDQFDYKGLGKTFKGLAQSGCWGCFDEFNRINLPVLSVAAQQIQTLLQAKRKRQDNLVFTDGQKISLDSSFAVVITMNPGYAGRQELPENMKVNFRVVAMMVPDRQIIIRVKLASCGFKDNVVLSQKFYLLYKLCEDQLSKQVHYDFGMRNIRAVLRTLGMARRQLPDEPEMVAVLRVLRDMNLSKLVDEDESLFLSLLDDLFPRVPLHVEKNQELQTAIDGKCQEIGLVNYPDWNLKIVQLYETQLVRHGIMVLGPTGVGKSTCINVLQGALTLMGTLTREYRMNPKAITSTQMFGALDVTTNDWTDGIFSTIWRRFLKMYNTSIRKQRLEAWWMVLDGPVDAVWIENLNSVLDDNKLLTLANGDRIPMAPNVKVIFEVHNIDNASPATVSRNGMVYMSRSTLPWRPIAQAWLNQRPDNKFRKSLMILLEQIFDATYEFVGSKLLSAMTVYECNYIAQIIHIVNGIEDEFTTLDQDAFDRLSTFALMWSFGALLELEDRLKFEEFLRNQSSTRQILNMQYKETESIFDYFVNDSGSWEHWENRVENWQYPTASESPIEYSKILVPNVDNVRTSFLVNIIAKQQKPVLLVGEQGTAKTVMLNNYLQSYDLTMYECKVINFSSATTPYQIQRTWESYFEKRVANTIGPVQNKRMIIFIDDVSMPMVNEWGDQTANEIVRQVIEFGGFYSLDKPGEWINIVDIQFLAAMIRPGGGRNDIPERLKRHFTIFNCTLPPNEAMDKIFGSIAYYFHESRGFNDEVIRASLFVVEATRNIWQTLKIKMLPTPAKFHYVFNLRDLSKIWEGMLQIANEECSTIESLIHLWRHECSRVLADRLIEESEIEWFTTALMNETNQLVTLIVTQKNEDTQGSVDLMSIASGDFRPSVIASKSEVRQSFVAEEELYCNFLRAEIEITDEIADQLQDDSDLMPRVYEKITDIEKVREILQINMNRMNDEVRGNNMDLVFFQDSIKHLLRISRIISKPKGHALLVGVGGSGKRSLAALAAYIAGHKIFKINVTRLYNAASFLEDMRVLYKMAAHNDKGVSFIFSDSDINDEQYLEYINNMLNSGEISGLLSKEEYEPILNDLAFSLKKSNPKIQITREALMSYYWQRLRANLHVILCFSPENKKFRERAMKFPGLISGCTIDWFHKWPLDALVSVSTHFLSKFEMDCRPNVKSAVIKVMSQIHDDVFVICRKYFDTTRRLVSVTPKSFLSFVSSYMKHYNEKREYYEKEKLKMKVGTEKLLEAADQVNEISKELVGKGKEIEDLNEIATVELKSTEGIKKDAEQQAERVEKIKQDALGIVDIILQQKAEADKEMEPAKEVLDECKKALLEITKSDIDYLKKLPNPPQLIMIIIDSILILLKYRVGPITINMNVGSKLPPFYNTNNAEISKMLGNPQIMRMLYELNPDELNDEILELTGAYFKYPGYDYKMAFNVFKNLAPLTNWAKKMEEYYDKNKAVLPLKNNVRKMEGKYIRAQVKLEKAEKEYEKTNEILQKCLIQYNKAMDEKKVVQDQYDKLQNRRDTAASLIDGLTDERRRWARQSVEFERTIKRLVGDALIGTAFLCYSGPFNQNTRQTLMNTWVQMIKQERIPMAEKYNLVTSMVDEALVNEWNLEGLPADRLSTENGIIIMKGSRYPLLIDPQLQGKNWIVNREASESLVITQLHSKTFRDQLEQCLSAGQTMLLEDVGEELDPALDNILDKKYYKLGTAMKCRIGDRDVDVNENFKLYITTKLSNPEYTPEIFARCSVIDFAVTMTGLEEQLLAIVINYERAEIERERINTAQEMSINQRRLKELEVSLLAKLTSIEGSVLDDPELIRVLSDNKSTASDIKQKMIIAEKTKVKLEFAREEYRAVAIRGSILYFLITEMALVNYMYQTSLTQFLEIFRQSMTTEVSKSYGKALASNQRAFDIVLCLTEMIWVYISRGIYRQDRTLFTILLALKIKLRAGDIKQAEFMTFIKGGASVDLGSCPTKRFSWIDDPTWMNLVELSGLPRFRNILVHLKENEIAWKQWLNTPRLEEASPPLMINEGINYEFDRLMLIRVWSADRILATSQHFIASTLGVQYTQPYLLNMLALVEESSPRKPLLALLSSGADPTNTIVAMALQFGKEISIISLGQGQESHARAGMLQAMESGNWLLLQNCHLGLEYMIEFYSTLVSTESHSDFRTWLTTENHPDFPIQILQCAIKFTNEAPQGVRAGLLRTYHTVTQEFLDSVNAKPWTQFVYTISYIHSIVQERRKYGPIGWNVPYEFSQTDWEASLKYIRNLLALYEKKPTISWKAIRYMIAEIQYGGRVTDDMDRRLLSSYSKLWLKDLLLKSPFDFCSSTGTYTMPLISNKLSDVNQFISNLPVTDKARIFGLHNNSDISYQIKQASYALSTIVSIQPKDDVIITPTSESDVRSSLEIQVDDQSREAIVYKIAGDMLTKLPEDFNEADIKRRLLAMGSIQPMSIFLSHEISRMQKLLRLIRQSLIDLRLAIDGIIVLSDDLRLALDNIYDGRVSPSWVRFSWISNGLGFWFTELLTRHAQFDSWLRKGRPKCFWFAGFFNPAGFLTAMRQEVTRAHQDWALDFVSVESNITKMNKEDVKQAPIEGVYIYGLYLEGASWDSKHGRLCESTNKLIFYSMPIIHMYAVNEKSKVKLKNQSSQSKIATSLTKPRALFKKEKSQKISTSITQAYECPIYRRAERTDANYITSIKLNSGIEQPSHWILRGVALLNNTN